MVSTDQSVSGSDTGSISGGSQESEDNRSKAKQKTDRRKSTVSRKKIKDRLFCVIFCCFNHVRNTRNWS